MLASVCSEEELEGEEDVVCVEHEGMAVARRSIACCIGEISS